MHFSVENEKAGTWRLARSRNGIRVRVSMPRNPRAIQSGSCNEIINRNLRPARIFLAALDRYFRQSGFRSLWLIHDTLRLYCCKKCIRHLNATRSKSTVQSDHILSLPDLVIKKEPNVSLRFLDLDPPGSNFWRNYIIARSKLKINFVHFCNLSKRHNCYEKSCKSGSK